MQTITDPQKLFNRMNERHSVLPHEFVEVCSVRKGKVKDLLKEASRLKGKALDEELNCLLKGISKETRKAPTLTKSKRAPGVHIVMAGGLLPLSRDRP